MWIERWLILCVKLAYFLICSFENMFAIIFMIHILLVVFYLFSVDNYMFRVGGGDASVQWRVCSELTVKTSVRRKFKSFGVFYCHFGCISHLVLVSMLLDLSR